MRSPLYAYSLRSENALADPWQKSRNTGIGAGGNVDTDDASPIDVVLDPRGALRHWLKTICVWTKTMHSRHFRQLVPTHTFEISYAASSKLDAAGRQASLEDTLSLLPSMDDARERLRTLAVERMRSGEPSNYFQNALQILASTSQDDLWANMFHGKVHCESELAWRMDERSPEDISLKVSFILPRYRQKKGLK